MKKAALCSMVLTVLCVACGARTSIDRSEYERPTFDADGSVLLDVVADRALSRPPRIEAGCEGQPLPTPQTPNAVQGPTRLYPVVLHDPSRRRVLVLGGLPSSGRFTREVYAVSSTDARMLSFTVTAPMELALAPAIAWIVPGRTALLIGGTLPGGMWSDRVVRADVREDGIDFSVVGTHPGGAVVGATAVFDPARAAVIVHGGEGIDRADPRPFAKTWIVRLAGTGVRWEVLLEEAASPPQAGSRLGGVDPRTGNIVFLGGYTRRDGSDRSVWTLSPGERPRWTRLDGAADVIPRSGNALFWDPVSCGFLVIGGRCADQLWLLRPEDSGVREALLGTMRQDNQTVGLGRESAGVAFDAEQRTLVLLAGVDCQSSGSTVRSNVWVSVR